MNADFTSGPAESSQIIPKVVLGRNAQSNSEAAISNALLINNAAQTLPSRALVVTTFLDNPAARSLPREGLGHQ